MVVVAVVVAFFAPHSPSAGAAIDQTSYATSGLGIRKNINTLTAAEAKSLRDALYRLKQNTSMINYQRLAGWHGYPGMCQQDGRQVACCHHGMASFPQWHRLFVRVFEMFMEFNGVQVRDRRKMGLVDRELCRLLLGLSVCLSVCL